MACSIQVRLFLQHQTGSCQRDHGPGIPGKQNLIIFMKLGPLQPMIIQLL